jgi:tRNA A-37 threonylcarbamoyl transferase component Bud32
MGSLFAALTIENLPERQIRVLRESTNTRPAIRLVEDNGVQGVVKDFSSHAFVYRNTIGRFLLWRESRAYQRLERVEGVPLLYRKLAGMALVISKVPGNDLDHLSGAEKPDLEFFQKLTRLIQKCHRHGTAHCDLKRSSNIMIDGSGNPYIVDWAAAITSEEFSIYPFRLIYKRFLEDDFKAVTKLKMRYCPERISDEEKRNYSHQGIAEPIIRTIRDTVRKWLQRVA